MEEVHDRLALLRAKRGLSLRGFAEILGERCGFKVSHDSARRYEEGETRIPAGYLQAVCKAFDITAEWLLLGAGPPKPPPSPLVEQAFEDIGEIVRKVQALEPGTTRPRLLEIVSEEWERFASGLPAQHPLREAVLESWARSRQAGVEPDPEGPAFRKVPDEELEEARRSNRDLLRAAPPHLEWLSTVLHDTPHVAYVVCGEGIVLFAEGSDPDLVEAWRLQPGYDWSEETMGTNGAGTALATGTTVAVFGPEHYVEAAKGSTCLAAPVRSPDGGIRGAIDLSTSFSGWRPERLALVAYVAEMIEADLVRATG